jgi:hypothetical protein
MLSGLPYCSFALFYVTTVNLCISLAWVSTSLHQPSMGAAAAFLQHRMVGCGGCGRHGLCLCVPVHHPNLSGIAGHQHYNPHLHSLDTLHPPHHWKMKNKTYLLLTLLQDHLIYPVPPTLNQHLQTSTPAHIQLSAWALQLLTVLQNLPSLWQWMYKIIDGHCR